MSEAADLRLLDDVQYRFALADTDEKLERTLNVYLVPTLLKLNTTSQAVIRKVVAICSHLSKRVKASNVSLPTGALLAQFHNPALGPYVKNFNLIYLDVALSREQNLDIYSPQILQGVSKLPPSAVKGYFPIMMRALARWKFDYETPGLRERLKLGDADVKALAKLFENLLLYDGTLASTPPPPPYVSKEGFPNLNVLNTAKLAAAKLTRGALGKDGNLALFIGARDGNSEVAEFCADAIKRGGVDLEEEQYIRGLYDLYATGPRINIKIAIVETLGKSVLAANTMPNMLRLVEEGFQGDTHQKLQRTHISFVQWVMRVGSNATVIPITIPLLSTLISTLQDPNAVPTLRGFFYICIGLIAHRNPSLIQQRIDTLQFLFDAAARESSSIQVSITECLSMVFPAIQNPPPEIANALLFLIQEAVKRAPSVAVKFAFAFPFANVPTKGVALAVLGQNQLTTDLQLTARYVLDPYYFRVTTQVSRTTLPDEFYAFPAFSEAMEGLVSLEGLDVIETLRYLRVIMLHEILSVNFKFDNESWRDRLDTAVGVDETVRSRIRQVLHEWAMGRHAALEKYFDYLRRVLSSGNDEQIAVATTYLLELVSLGGKEISGELAQDVNGIKELIFSRNELLREKSARLLGMVSGSLSNIESLIRSLLRFSEGSVEKQHGAILAVASIIARRAMKGDLTAIPKEILNKFATDLSQIIISPTTNTILLEAGLQGLSDLCIFGAGELISSSDRDQISTRLQSLSKTTRHGSLQDRSILTLGYLSFALNFPEDEQAINIILEALYAVHEQKQVELLFSAGQALSCVVARWDSKAMTPFRDAEVQFSMSHIPALLERVLSDILEGVRSPKHPLRKAASIWLLSLLQFCDEADGIKRNLERIHSAFVSLLTDRDGFVQDTASKGMALVYLRGDKKMQEDMIWNLVGSVTSEVRPSTSVTGTIAPDTQVFSSLNTDAGEVSTYKEICNLASDTGNPELIYRFLALSSHSALWQSRKGAAIGIGGLLDQFSMRDFLERNPNYAKRLVPKLYRLCRDPNPGVAKAMQDIWDAAFGKTASPLIVSMFPDIMKELLAGMGDKTWRTRQASAKAMSDLCSGVELSKLEPYLGDIWKMAFRVADDIKESVRTAGVRLSQQLTTSLIRSVSEKKTGQSVISTVMPFLLGNSGLNSSAQGVQLFALQSIVKLCDEAGPLLKPMIPEIVDQLLDVLTSLEPQEVNYIGFHVDKNDTQALDEARFHAVRSSPVMNAIERCIDLADEGSMDELAPIIFSKMKRAAGLPTKVLFLLYGLTKAGCAKLIVSLVMRKAHLFRPYADQALQAVTSCLNDRNETVRKTYAVTAGYLARLVSHQNLIKYIQSQTQKYFSEGHHPSDLLMTDETQRAMSGIAIEAISRNASSAFTAIAASILPFVFMAKHDPAESVREPYTETWNENTGGTGAIKLYIREIMMLVAGHLEDQQWRVKQVSALTLADACEAIGVDIKEHLDLVLPLLIRGVGGRTWKGKEAVLKALVVVAQNARDYLSASQIEEISKILMRESKRKDLEYKRYATAEFAKYLSTFESVNLFNEVKEIVEDGFEELNEEDENDLQMKPIRLLLRANLYALVTAAYRPSIDPETAVNAKWIIGLVTSELPKATVWSTRIALCKSIQTFIGNCKSVPQLSVPEDLISSLWARLKIVAGDRGYESVRTAAAKAISDFISWVDEHPEWNTTQSIIKLELPSIIAEETSGVIRAELTR